MGLRAETGRGKPGASQILEEEEGDLGHHRGRWRLSLRDRDAGIGVDRGPGAQAEDWKGKLPAGNGNGWLGSIVDAQLRVPPTPLPESSPCPHDIPSVRAREGVGILTISPFPSGVQCTQVGRSRTPCL